MSGTLFRNTTGPFISLPFQTPPGHSLALSLAGTTFSATLECTLDADSTDWVQIGPTFTTAVLYNTPVGPVKYRLNLASGTVVGAQYSSSLVQSQNLYNTFIGPDFTASITAAQSTANSAQGGASANLASLNNTFAGLAAKGQSDGRQIADGSLWDWSAGGAANGSTVVAASVGFWNRALSEKRVNLRLFLNDLMLGVAWLNINGGTLVIDPGSYNYTGTPIITRSGVAIEGKGSPTTLLNKRSNAVGLSVQATGVTLKGFSLLGGIGGAGGNPAFADTSDGLIIGTFATALDGTQGAGYVNAQDLTMTDVYIWGHGRDGISQREGRGVRTDYVTSRGNTRDGFNASTLCFDRAHCTFGFTEGLYNGRDGFRQEAGGFGSGSNTFLNFKAFGNFANGLFIDNMNNRVTGFTELNGYTNMAVPSSRYANGYGMVLGANSFANLIDTTFNNDGWQDLGQGNEVLGSTREDLGGRIGRSVFKTNTLRLYADFTGNSTTRPTYFGGLEWTHPANDSTDLHPYGTANDVTTSLTPAAGRGWRWLQKDGVIDQLGTGSVGQKKRSKFVQRVAPFTLAPGAQTDINLGFGGCGILIGNTAFVSPTQGNAVSATAAGFLDAGLFWCMNYIGNDACYIRLYNPTAASITTVQRDWSVSFTAWEF